MSITAVIGGQWGDEGKGKIVDLLSKDAQLVARFQGGANAGHTVYLGNKKIVLHQVPSGVLSENCKCILGNGMVIDPVDLVAELDMLKENGIQRNGSIYIAPNSHIVTPVHKWIDSRSEENSGQKIGDKVQLKQKVLDQLDKAVTSRYLSENDRNDILPEIDIFLQSAEMIAPMVEDTFGLIHKMAGNGNNILLEGAQGTLLDVNHGTYPFVTSSSPSTGGISTGLGLPLTKINRIIGIFKAYTTRVGKGPFPTELFDEDGDKLTDLGKEYGATTGRRILDHFENIKICTEYQFNGELTSQMSQVIADLEDVKPVYQNFDGWQQTTTGIDSYDSLPEKTREYIQFISDFLGVPVKIISTGPGRDEIIHN